MQLWNKILTNFGKDDVAKPLSDEEFSAANELIDQMIEQLGELTYHHFNFANTDAAKSAGNAPRAAQRLLLLTVLKRLQPFTKETSGGRPEQSYAVPMMLLHALLRIKLPLVEADAVELVRFAISVHNNYLNIPASGLAKTLKPFATQAAIDPMLREEVHRYQNLIADSSASSDIKVAVELANFGNKGPSHTIQPGEAWSDALLTYLETLGDDREPWVALIGFCQTAKAGKPSAKWLKEGLALLDELDQSQFIEQTTQYFELADKPRTEVVESWREYEPNPNLLIVAPNADALKGLVWLCSTLDSADQAGAIGRLAQSAYRKVPGVGPRAVKVGNACVWALGQMTGDSALAALASLKVKVRFKTAQNGISKSLEALAERAGVSKEELEEIGVPAFGLSEVGRHTESWQEYNAELTINDRFRAELRWANKGKAQASPPKYVKDRHGDDLKELKQAVKDINAMLSAQRERLDGLFLAEKSWPYDYWCTHYLNHPLVGCLARKLIWTVTANGQSTSIIWHSNHLVDANNKPLDFKGADLRVQLWHPIQAEQAEIVAWREWLETSEVRQPFKQAHREIYLLTDAERSTNTYSNRFAGHVLKQHQFNALCAVRGWNSTLRLMVDDEYSPPERVLSHWQLRAEYWVEGAGEEYGVDTNETGTFLYLATDQVRFYKDTAASSTTHASGGGYRSLGTDREENQPLPLADVPNIVLSEVMRDVDLFVGVASVGNDPDWLDGGAEHRHLDYWQGFSFGDLSETAVSRKDALERLVPRLNIADRCSFEERFLVVKGDVRTYKIHLGSSNILMEPNDQYLCIVASQAKGKQTDKLFIPFEGDARLALVLSKAFLLANDKKITDKTILSQINSR